MDRPLRVLLTEGSSLSAREHVTVLGRGGVHVELVSSQRHPFAGVSRWCRRVHPLPAASIDPGGYLDGLADLLDGGDYDALLATHEQAWLLAAGGDRLPADAPMAIPALAALQQVQGKVAACETFDELGIPQPVWQLLSSPPSGPFPVWLKSDFSTAGRGVRLVSDRDEAGRVWEELSGGGQRVLAQAPAEGQYGQVAAVFDAGRMVGVHCTVSIGQGAGGSAAARLGVDHPLARGAIERLGAGLAWHGGLTLDYVHQRGKPLVIECNPRTVEPGNAARSGVNLPLLTVAVIQGRAPSDPMVGAPGVRTRGLAALVLGAAEVSGDRTSVAEVLTRGLLDPVGWAEEMLTPLDDPRSLIPLGVVSARLLAHPASAARLTEESVAAYGVTPTAVETLKGGR